MGPNSDGRKVRRSLTEASTADTADDSTGLQAWMYAAPSATGPGDNQSAVPDEGAAACASHTPAPASTAAAAPFRA